MKEPRFIYWTRVYRHDELIDARVSFHPQQLHQLIRIHSKFDNARNGHRVTCMRYDSLKGKWDNYTFER